MNTQEPSVVIQEPAVEHIRKKSSCLKRTCTVGCIGGIIAVIGSLLFLHVILRPKHVSLQKVPLVLTEEVDLYDVDSLQEIRYTPSHAKHPIVDALLFVPKAIVSPIFFAFETKGIDIPDAEWIRRTHFFVTSPIEKTEREYELVWDELPAQPTFLYNYYQQVFGDAGFELTDSVVLPQQLRFRAIGDNFSAAIYITDDVSRQGTDRIRIIFYLPEEG